MQNHLHRFASYLPGLVFLVSISMAREAAQQRLEVNAPPHDLSNPAASELPFIALYQGNQHLIPWASVLQGFIPESQDA